VEQGTAAFAGDRHLSRSGFDAGLHELSPQLAAELGKPPHQLSTAWTVGAFAGLRGPSRAPEGLERIKALSCSLRPTPW
jgi:hypothetical protein